MLLSSLNCRSSHPLQHHEGFGAKVRSAKISTSTYGHQVVHVKTLSGLDENGMPTGKRIAATRVTKTAIEIMSVIRSASFRTV
jgi:hypothetical protein